MSLILSIQQGDIVAFEQVFDEYHHKLYFFVLGRTHSIYLAEETVQETFVKLWRYRSSLKEEIPISTQIFRIARTVLIDLQRKQKRQENLYKAVDLTEQSVTLQPDESVELSNLIANAIRRLPPTRRTVFHLSRVEGMSNREIADALSISGKTVENHITLAIKQLRVWLADYLPAIVFILMMIRG